MLIIFLYYSSSSLALCSLPDGELHSGARLPELLIVGHNEVVHLPLLLEDQVQALLQLLLASSRRALDEGLPGTLTTVDLYRRGSTQ